MLPSAPPTLDLFSPIKHSGIFDVRQTKGCHFVQSILYVFYLFLKKSSICVFFSENMWI